MLRTSSLPAVISLVWSTRPRPARTASARRVWRTKMRSASPVIGATTASGSTRSICIGAESTEAGQTLLGVERRLEMAHGHAQLDEGDGDGRLDADHDRFRAEEADH